MNTSLATVSKPLEYELFRHRSLATEAGVLAEKGYQVIGELSRKGGTNSLLLKAPNQQLFVARIYSEQIFKDSSEFLDPPTWFQEERTALQYVNEYYRLNPNSRPILPKLVETFATLTETQAQYVNIYTYLKGESLDKHLNSNPITEEQAYVILKDLLTALSILAEDNRAYRDMHPRNIIFDKENMVAGLTDVNSSKRAGGTQVTQVSDLTLYPQSVFRNYDSSKGEFRDKKLELSGDVAALGASIIQLLHGAGDLYSDPEKYGVRRRSFFSINVREYVPPLCINSLACSKELKNFLKYLTNENSIPTAKEALLKLERGSNQRDKIQSSAIVLRDNSLPQRNTAPIEVALPKLPPEYELLMKAHELLEKLQLEKYKILFNRTIYQFRGRNNNVLKLFTNDETRSFYISNDIETFRLDENSFQRLISEGTNLTKALSATVIPDLKKAHENTLERLLAWEIYRAFFQDKKNYKDDDFRVDCRFRDSDPIIQQPKDLLKRLKYVYEANRDSHLFPTSINKFVPTNIEREFNYGYLARETYYNYVSQHNYQLVLFSFDVNSLSSFLSNTSKLLLGISRDTPRYYGFTKRFYRLLLSFNSDNLGLKSIEYGFGTAKIQKGGNGYDELIYSPESSTRCFPYNEDGLLRNDLLPEVALIRSAAHELLLAFAINLFADKSVKKRVISHL